MGGMGIVSLLLALYFIREVREGMLDLLLALYSIKEVRGGWGYGKPTVGYLIHNRS